MIADVYQEFFSLWQPIFEEIGYRIETKGNLPLVELGLIDPNDIPLSPKKRYKYMDAYFKNSGKYGKYMMRASASTQISIDYASQQDLIRKLRILEKISPILMTMMENKTKSDTRLPEEQEKTHLLRIQEWDDLDPERTGFFPYSFDDDFGYDKIADVVYHTPLILLTDKGETTYIGHQDAAKLVEDHVILEDNDPDRTRSLVEHVLSMGFFHFRIKKYIEIRIADSVPIDKALGYTALLKGIVYSDDNLDTLEQELKDIDTLTKIQDAVLAIERKGSDAVIYHGKTVKDWSDYLIHLARNSLPETEKGYLDHV